METFFIGDPHFGHRLVSGLRGFKNTDEHDQTIMQNWRERIKPGDEVFVMGDLAMSNPKHHFWKLENLPGTKHLIIGNHDYCHPLKSNSHNRLRQYYEFFETVQLQAQTSFKGTRFMLHHFPYTNDHTETDRHVKWRPFDAGQPLIHAHTHSNVKFSRSPKGTPQICTSLEAWGLRPVSFAEIHEEYKRQK